jgi:alanyl-tRNA synthetase
MTSNQIRQQFLDFFQSKQHLIVPSAPLVLKNDPTLMFTNAGMNQFKDYFLGNKVATSKRIADTQKCLRVSGKHNDLEDVGFDTYHHTLFEMLGNWSFGDYFKNEAIAWAWELLTDVYKLPKERLYVTVFEGDKKENLDFDQEAFAIWAELVPDKSHILKGNKKDNFWEMGDTGPCGPCSEIHIDLRPQAEIDKVSGHERVNNDDPQVIEIWNNVFIQYNRKVDGSLEPLPDKHVDTGMGFERLVRVIQGKTSNYDTDIFQPLIQTLEQKANVKYQTEDSKPEDKKGVATDTKTDIAMRVISDHVRAVSFAIADGQLPSNAKAGYVIRRILRRAVRYGYTFLGFREPFIYQLVEVLANQFANVFPELKAQESFVQNVIREEEVSFLRTLENGIRLLEEEIRVLKAANGTILTGKTVFELYDTFGFPVDLTSLIARENDLSIDEKGFELEMQQQKARSRNASASETSDWVVLNEVDKVEFVGYDLNETITQIVKYRSVKTKDKTLQQIVLESTPFYAESGGQVGDIGTLTFTVHGVEKQINILDTKKENDLIIHFTEDKIDELVQSVHIKANINTEKRAITRSHHSATHLLQSALRIVLGNHVAQKGSLVNADLLRFDFSHFAKLSEVEIEKVETIVNQKIRENVALDEKRNVPIQKALELGATALFGEKYGDFVRVITFDKNYSVELCGGTHVSATGNIGYFKIVSEASVAAGVRRIEAVTSVAAEKYINKNLATIEELEGILKAKDVRKAVENLVSERQSLQKKLEQLEQLQIQSIKKELISKISPSKGLNVLIESVELSNADAIKTLAFELKAKVENLVAVFTADLDGKPHISIIVSENIVAEKGIQANQLIKEFSKEIQGGGGGQPFFATAGGKDLSGLERVLVRAKQIFL